MVREKNTRKFTENNSLEDQTYPKKSFLIQLLKSSTKFVTKKKEFYKIYIFLTKNNNCQAIIN
jgi:hypothetical protein